MINEKLAKKIERWIRSFTRGELSEHVFKVNLEYAGIWVGNINDTLAKYGFPPISKPEADLEDPKPLISVETGLPINNKASSFDQFLVDVLNKHKSRVFTNKEAVARITLEIQRIFESQPI